MGAPDRLAELPECAFFVGKLNKSFNREPIYQALKSLGQKRGTEFYIRRLDMPYKDKARQLGNHGFCFVHVNTREEAQRIIRLGHITLLDQSCEVKSYQGRDGPRGSSRTHSVSSTGIEFMRKYGDELETVSHFSFDSGCYTPQARPGSRQSIGAPEPVPDDDLRKILGRKYADKHAPRWANEESCNSSVVSEENTNQCLEDVMSETETISSEQASHQGHQTTLETSASDITANQPALGQAQTQHIFNEFLRACALDAHRRGQALEFINDFQAMHDKCLAKVKGMGADEIINLAASYPAVLTATVLHKS